MRRVGRIIVTVCWWIPIVIMALATIGLGLISILLPGKDSYERRFGWTVRAGRSWRSNALRGWLED